MMSGISQKVNQNVDDKLQEIEDEKERERQEEHHRRETDTNYNPLLMNGVNNKDIFRTLLFHFGTDNYVPIVGRAPKFGMAVFIKNFIGHDVRVKNGVRNTDDEAANHRFLQSLITLMKPYAMDGFPDRIAEDKFCELMRTFNNTSNYELSDEDQYDQYLERLFYRIQSEQTTEVGTAEMKKLIEKSGFEFQPGEFENLMRWYFNGKDTITMDEFKLFAKGSLVQKSEQNSR